jgi:ATP-dependent helicase Lhr and Lhr-like helicase
MELEHTKGFTLIKNWLAENNCYPFPFQLETWEAIHNQQSALVNAPTGCGKTFSVYLGVLIQYINNNPNYRTAQNIGTQLIWITPLRALAKDIGRAMEEVLTQLQIPWHVGVRNGDTTTSERTKQKKQPPEILITTPESLHLILAQKGHELFFKNLKVLAIDEWHELLGSKRGVQTELAVSYIHSLTHKKLLVYGISATVGNLQQAAQVLLHSLTKKPIIIKADINKKLEVETIFPDEIEKLPWAGHIGTSLIHKIIPIILNNQSTLVFINTRGMAEIWYQAILTACPELSGSIAIHHGSINQELRTWVEDSLHNGSLKCVIATSSLDLGVDFRPVETVIQIGSPKGVSRFLQRAGRSGHSPFATSKIYFLPTHSLEILESAALQKAISEQEIEAKDPLVLCFDVLIQFLCTLAVGNGFEANKVLPIIKKTHAFKFLQTAEWEQILQFIVSGGNSLQAYDEYKRVEIIGKKYMITNKRLAMRHRLHIGTIVSDPMLLVKYMSGGFLGFIEEYFISKLIPGNCFVLAGKVLELIQIKGTEVIVKNSQSKKAIIPSWVGGRMPLSNKLSSFLREQVEIMSKAKKATWPEHKTLEPLINYQKQLSHVPTRKELLVEMIDSKDGHHLFVYPMEGRLVHEAMATITAKRLSALKPITFTMAMNDYGFELHSDLPIPFTNENKYDILSPQNLILDVETSMNQVEMARRKFRDIAVISGLVFTGMPGKEKKQRHIQSSSSLIYNVFETYDATHFLLRQANNEVLQQQMEIVRLQAAYQRIATTNIIIKQPTAYTPFCFPLKVDSIRETLSSEKLAERIRRMMLQ